MLAWIDAHAFSIAMGLLCGLLVVVTGLVLSCVIAYRKPIETESDREKRRRG